ncbi:MAG: SRPBCC domain-containing protein [Methanomassiliicoccales archaeon]|jgi:activator of HSP90 ATPase
MTKRTRTIVQKVVIPTSPDEVYEAFMDPAKHSNFTQTETAGSQEVGGKVSASDGYITARNVELKRGKKIVQEWTTSEWPEGYPPSILQLDLKKVDEGTELTMTHSRVPDEQADDYAEGWMEYYWKPLVEYFQKAKDGT